MAEEKKRSGLTVLAVMAAFVALSSALCLAGGVYVLSRFDAAYTGEWVDEPLTATRARDIFGLEALPKVVLKTQQKESGAQDPFFDALLQIPPADEAAFLRSNGLSRDAQPLGPFAGSIDEYEARIREVAAPTGSMKVVPLAGVREAHLADGGSVVEYRNVVLLEFSDQLWVACVAFDT